MSERTSRPVSGSLGSGGRGSRRPVDAPGYPFSDFRKAFDARKPNRALLDKSATYGEFRMLNCPSGRSGSLASRTASVIPSKGERTAPTDDYESLDEDELVDVGT